jgi:ribosomal protein S18 acetylase RimI-like enzyme
MGNEVQIVPLNRAARDVRRFLKAACAVYADDPHWVAPLLMDVEKVFSAANPFFEHAEMQLFVAAQSGRDVGRIAAIVDREYIKSQQDEAAFFGFFETINNPQVSQPLFDAASAWAKQKGLKRLLGPMNPSTNDECGLLVSGFDASPVFMMTYNPAYYVGLVEQAGFIKSKDLLAFFFDVANAPVARFERIAAKFAKREPDLALRPIRKRTLAQDIQKVTEVYNEAWEANWGFVPMTAKEIHFMAGRLKPLLYEGLAYLMEAPGETVGFLLAMPDYNQAFKHLNGRLLSPGLVRALPYLLQWKTPDIVRVITLGVKAKYRGRGIEAAMLCHGLRTGFKAGFKSVEASWVLEENAAVQRVIELFGGKVYKTYRIYGKEL